MMLYVKLRTLTQDKIDSLENLPVVFAEFSLRNDPGDPRHLVGTFRDQRDERLGQIEKCPIKRYLQETGGKLVLGRRPRKKNMHRRTFYNLLTRHRLEGGGFFPRKGSNVALPLPNMTPLLKTGVPAQAHPPRPVDPFPFENCLIPAGKRTINGTP